MRSYYKLLSGPYNEVFSWECIWCAKVPKRVSFFLWTAVRDGILTIDNLVKRGQYLVNRCCLCFCDKETVDHLLLHCKFFLMHYGVQFSRFLGFIGKCQSQLALFSLLGEIGLESICQPYGIWSWHV